VFALKSTCIILYDVILPESSISSMCHRTVWLWLWHCHVTRWQCCHINTNPEFLEVKEKEITNENWEMRKVKVKWLKSTVLNSDITSLQGFFSGETDFHFRQFLSNFLRYSFSNFPLFYPYNIFAVYFPGNSLFLIVVATTRHSRTNDLTTSKALSRAIK